MNNSLSKEDKIYILLGAIFVGLLVVSNIIASKIIMVAGLVGPAAVIVYSLTFVITDTINELWGKERTKYIVKLGFLVSVISAIFIRLAIIMPAAPFWDDHEAYNLILGSNLRIVFASLVAYLVSQYHDIWAFMFWRRLTGERFLWLRNNLSTGASQLIDTSLFITLAFWGTGIPLMPMIIGQFLFKLIIAAIDTPIVYLLIGVIKRNTNIEGTSSEVKAS